MVTFSIKQLNSVLDRARIILNDEAIGPQDRIIFSEIGHDGDSLSLNRIW